MQCDISLMSLALDAEDTWVEATHECLLVAKSEVLKGGNLFLKYQYLMIFPDDTFKVSHASKNIEFMWRGKSFVVP